MTRKLTASIFCLSLLPNVVMAAQDVVVYRADGTAYSNHPIQVSGGQQEQTGFERIFWNKTPVEITLRTGRERLIHFPDMVRVKPPEDRSAEELKISVVDNVVYLKALKDFPTGRMRVQAFNHASGSFEGGEIYLLDLSARQRGGTEQVLIIDKANSPSASSTQALAQTQAQATDPLAAQGYEEPDQPSVDMVELVRYAAQQLYAPERLMPSHPAVYRTPLRVKTLTAFYRGGELQSTPLASWKGSGLYVTAVKLQNTTTMPLTLDPRLFRGQWRSRTLQHTGLARHHNEADTTTVYLVSDRPFHESLWF